MSRRATAKKALEELRRGRAPEPPAGLREKLLSEVPETLDLAPEVAGGETGGRGLGRRPGRWALAAASVVLAVGAGVVAVRVMERMEPPAVVQPTAEPARAPAEGAAEDAPPSARAQERAAPYEAAEEGPEPAASGPQAPPERKEIAGEAPRKVFDPAPGEPPAREGRVADGPASGGVRLEKVPTAEEEFDRQSMTASSLSDRVNTDRTGAAREEAVTVTSESPKLDQRLQDLHRRIVEAEPGPPLSVPAPPPPPPPIYARNARIPESPLHVAPPSTGGTAEPNDQPYGDVFFRAYGTNPFLDTEDDPLSTFALDVDTGSWGVVRRYLSDGHLPPPEAVRVEELVNAFDYGDPPPEESEFALYSEGSGAPFMAGERYHLVRFGLKAREVAAADRKPATLTFVVDVSGSMAREDRLGLVRRSLLLLLDELRPDDRVGLVVYGDRGQVLLPHSGDLGAVQRAVERLLPGGSTNAEEGLTLGYELARRAFREGAINRVILCSDGVANVGATGPESILERIGDEARRGIELTTVGFGMGNYNDVLMEQLANRGDGAYAYVDTLDEARRVFVEELTGTLQTVARDAKVQVAFDPEVVARYRLLGYENRDVPDERFRDDTVDAGEVGAGHAVTALYEVKLRPGARGRATAATLSLRWRSAETGEVREVAEAITVRELRRSWEEASRGLRLASVVAELAEILKRSYWAKDGDLDDLFRRAQALSAEYPGDLRVAELATLIGKAARLHTP